VSAIRTHVMAQGSKAGKAIMKTLIWQPIPPMQPGDEHPFLIGDMVKTQDGAIGIIVEVTRFSITSTYVLGPVREFKKPWKIAWWHPSEWTGVIFGVAHADVRRKLARKERL